MFRYGIFPALTYSAARLIFTPEPSGVTRRRGALQPLVFGRRMTQLLLKTCTQLTPGKACQFARRQFQQDSRLLGFLRVRIGNQALHKTVEVIRPTRDRGREEFLLPALRTVHAVLPHTALQSVVSSSGLARLHTGFMKGEKPMCREECIWPALMVLMRSTMARAFLTLA